MPEETDQLSLDVFNPVRAEIAETQEKDAKLTFDYTTEEGVQEALDWVKEVKKPLIALEKTRVKVKDHSLKFGRSVDSLAKELKAPFFAIIAKRMKPIKEAEDAKRAAAEKIVADEQAAEEQAEKDRLAALEQREKAAAAKEAELKAAQDAIDAKQREADQAEREKQLVAEAAEKATKEAEAKAKAEAEEKEKAGRERQRRVMHKEKLAEEAEAKRVADKTHRDGIEAEIQQAVEEAISIGADNNFGSADALVMALIDGNIPHITINY